MSVIVGNNCGWILDHWDSVVLSVTEAAVKQTGDNCGLALCSKIPVMSDTLSNTEEENCCSLTTHYRLKRDLFKILTPFKMDSQFISSQRLSTSLGQEIKEKRKRKRKRKEPLNSGEQMAEDYHKEVSSHIAHGHESLTRIGREMEYFSIEHPTSSMLDNNTAARVASNIRIADDTLTCLCEDKQQYGDCLCEGKRQYGDCLCEGKQQYGDCIPAHLLSKANDLQEMGAVHVIWKQVNDTSMLVTLQSERYIIPPRCTFLMSDIGHFHKAYQDLGKFDLLVMDPPWENKSVKRKKKYGSLQNEMVLDLPLTGVMNPGCTVAVWVTNRVKHIQFVTEQLFRRHQIQFRAKCFWLKVTRDGQMVYNLDSPHKKPYETLIIGEYTSENVDSDCHDNRYETISNKVILSVPCSLHSKKPPLKELLKNYLPIKPKCLELFARNLCSDWTSWGNEVLLHQHIDFYESVT